MEKPRAEKKSRLRSENPYVINPTFENTVDDKTTESQNGAAQKQSLYMDLDKHDILNKSPYESLRNRKQVETEEVAAGLVSERSGGKCRWSLICCFTILVVILAGAAIAVAVFLVMNNDRSQTTTTRDPGRTTPTADPKLADPCDPNPCKNGGRCFVQNSTVNGVEYICDCYASRVYRGPTCEDPLKPKWASWSSWTVCDVTCGGGQQERYRKCMDPIPDDSLSCVGPPEERESCATWNCPDCSLQCEEGTLNADCDACECSESVLHGRVTDTTNRPLSEASIAYADAPYTILAVTNSTGFFNIQGVCPQDRPMVVSKYQYVMVLANTTKESSTSSSLTVEMIPLELPIIIDQPRNKFRSVGDSVAFCCHNVKSSSPIKKFEWFQDGDLIQSADNDTLVIGDLTLSHSGSYRCRITTDAGSVYSSPALLSVSADLQAGCTSNPLPNEIALPIDCVQTDTGSATYDIGACPTHQECGGDKINQTECIDTEFYCCGVSKREEIQVQCSGYKLVFESVKECGCQLCVLRFAALSGSVVDHIDNTGISFIRVYVDGDLKTSTNSKGEFSMSLDIGTYRRVSVSFRDDIRDKYETLTKVYVIGSGATIKDVIRLRVLPEPVIFQSSSETSIPIGQNGMAPFADIVIPPDDVYTSDGHKHEGPVKAFVSIVDIRNSTDLAFTQGDFTTTDDTGETQTLQTFGMFSVTFRDETGNTVNVGGDVSMEVKPDVIPMMNVGGANVKLWKLNEGSGGWEVVEDLYSDDASSRRKRQRPGSVVFDGLGSNTFNVDLVFPEQYLCFAKVNVTPGITDGQVWIESQTREQLISRRFTFKDQHEVSSGSGACTRVACYDQPDIRYKTYISATTAGGKILKPTRTSEDCSNVQYEILDDVIEVFSTGPLTENCQLLYQTEGECTDGRNSFSFEEVTDNSGTIHYNYTYDHQANGYSVFHPISDALLQHGRDISGNQCGDEAITATEEFCFIKIKLEFHYYDVYKAPVVLRAESVSSMFQLEDFLPGRIDLPITYGFRDTFFQSAGPYPHNPQVGYICLEYKCNGRIFWPFEVNTILDPNICPIGEGTTRIKITVRTVDQETMLCSVSDPKEEFANAGLRVNEEKVHTLVNIPDNANEDDGVYSSGSSGRMHVAEDECVYDGSEVSFTLKCTLSPEN